MTREYEELGLKQNWKNSVIKVYSHLSETLSIRDLRPAKVREQGTSLTRSYAITRNLGGAPLYPRGAGIESYSPRASLSSKSHV